MSAFIDPYDPDRALGSACSCGQHASQSEHDSSGTLAGAETEALSNRIIESTMIRALFPEDQTRRKFIRAVGVNTAMAAIASVLPIGAMQALAQEKKSPEKSDLKIGFIPITCATPLIMADPLGFYKKEGLYVTLN